MNTDHSATVHFVRAWYYYARANSIWHIHLSRATKRLRDNAFVRMMNDMLEEHPDLSDDRPMCEEYYNLQQGN